ncbi:hypothetical protein CDAR_476011 [Caerostris darwini]|uniref:Uncharacterized protein n=1 Tax=Caerostris darwini TaxID=1538125 RepID=A0AAV4PEB4_9ARAC|nr:hypothetical protein CDAR_476011 [Caerostris darwini]
MTHGSKNSFFFSFPCKPKIQLILPFAASSLRRTGNTLCCNFLLHLSSNCCVRRARRKRTESNHPSFDFLDSAIIALSVPPIPDFCLVEKKREKLKLNKIHVSSVF